MSNENIIISCENIFKSYRMGKTKLDVLKGIDIQIPSGQFTAITGASGSGKSTLLHILGALDTPDKGSVCFKGENIAKFGSKKINEFRNKKVGFIFQFYHLLEELSVLENVLLAKMAQCSALKWAVVAKTAKKRAKMLLEQVDMLKRSSHRPSQLSGGERQRVAIARALMNAPEIILADEPTGNLDTETGSGILKLFAQLRSEGQTIIMVTHDIKIADHSDKVVVLADGRIKVK